MQLLQQKEVKSDVEKAFGVVTDVSNKIGPLYKKLNMPKFNQEKEDLNKQIKSTKENLLKGKKKALAEIEKAYELFCVYFVGKACTQWDKVVQVMHTKDPWVAVNGTTHKGPGLLFWTALNSTSSQSSLVTPLSCIHTKCNSMARSPNTVWCMPSFHVRAFSMTTWLICPQ
jgi:hypothetical protein